MIPITLETTITMPTLFLTAAILVAATLLLTTAPAVANEEMDALLAFRKGVQDPGGDLKSWDANLVDPCTWMRVECNDDKRVTRLELLGLNLTGGLAPELGKLEQLQYMGLEANNLNGPIPSEYGNLKSLFTMDLSNNNLSGRIPSTIGDLKSLHILRLDHNRLTGPIPVELTGLPVPLVADFSDNDLCGTIPTGGAFRDIPAKSFDGNPRLKRPAGMEGGAGGDDTSC